MWGQCIIDIMHNKHKPHEITAQGHLLVLPAAPRPNYLNMKPELQTVGKPHLLSTASTQNQQTG